MYKFVLDDLHAGYDIYVNPISSPAGRYLSRRPHIFALIKELTATTNLRGKRVVIEKNMGRDIGTSDVVLTGEADVIYYAQPLKSTLYSRFAKNRDPQTTSMLTAVFERDGEGNYEVTDTWIGEDRPPLPGDIQETAKSKEFWQTHAYVHDSQTVQLKSVTKVCPY